MKTQLKAFAKKTVVVATGAVASASAFAADHSEAINTAVTDGQANYSLVVVGVIGLAAIGFGVSMIVSAMRN